MAFLSSKLDQFTYFAEQLNELDWRGRDVLDFGGNVGNILGDPNSTIEESRYWCVDVIREAIEAGSKRHPEGNWIHYDRYSLPFNPGGTPDLGLPEIAQRFDFIVAYSVFTSTRRSEMLDLVGQLRRLLKPGGALAFTFIDPHYRAWPEEYEGDNFRWRLERIRTVERVRDYSDSIPIPELLERAAGAQWLILVNADDLYVENEELRVYPVEEQESCHVFYTQEYMQSLFLRAAILPPANDEMQHCCVIRAPAG